jgi:hypothetical protein
MSAKATVKLVSECNERTIEIPAPGPIADVPRIVADHTGISVSRLKVSADGRVGAVRLKPRALMFTHVPKQCVRGQKPPPAFKPPTYELFERAGPRGPHLFRVTEDVRAQPLSHKLSEHESCVVHVSEAYLHLTLESAGKAKQLKLPVRSTILQLKERVQSTLRCRPTTTTSGCGLPHEPRLTARRSACRASRRT